MTHPPCPGDPTAHLHRGENPRDCLTCWRTERRAQNQIRAARTIPLTGKRL